MKFKEVKIIDIFDDCPSDKTLTREKIQNLKGDYPVYTATIGKPFGMVKFYNNTKPALLVVNDGAAGYTYIVEDEYYTLGKHVTGLTLKEEYKDCILLKYVQIVAQPILILKNKSEGRGNLPKQDLMNVKIPIPVDVNGNFNLLEQSKLADKHQRIENQKKKLIEKKQEIENIKLAFSHEVATIDVKFNDLFILKRGNVISKEMIHNNAGIYPVYSTQIDGVLGYLNSFIYDGEYLLWNTDGLAGYIKHVKGKFSFTNIVGIMIFHKDVDSSNLDLRYIKNYLEPLFRSNVKGRMGDKGKNEYTKFNSTMIKELDFTIPIPVKANGIYDLEVQKQLADKIELVEKQKKTLIDKIDVLINTEIIIGNQ
ncbi:restriction endonuclease subunit S [Paenibacillus taichungensis]|uniref:restriction endonuclease subunit S n=1 Tax=Paenibacillus taichungensis TaxID=484184 RepID=UPI003D9A4EF4